MDHFRISIRGKIRHRSVVRHHLHFRRRIIPYGSQSGRYGHVFHGRWYWTFGGTLFSLFGTLFPNSASADHGRIDHLGWYSLHVSTRDARLATSANYIGLGTFRETREILVLQNGLTETTFARAERFLLAIGHDGEIDWR